MCHSVRGAALLCSARQTRDLVRRAKTGAAGKVPDQRCTMKDAASHPGRRERQVKTRCLAQSLRLSAEVRRDAVKTQHDKSFETAQNARPQDEVLCAY